MTNNTTELRDSTTEGPALNTRANAKRIAGRKRTEMDTTTTTGSAAESEQLQTTANASESQPSQQINGAMITAIEGIVTKLQQVAVGPANPSYSISKLTGIGENVDEWLEHFERHARLQQLAVTQYCDAFHVTGVAETWFFTLPKTTSTDWVKLREACQQRFAGGYCRRAVAQGCSTMGLPLGAGQFPAKWVSRQGGAYKRGGGQRIEAKAGGLYELGMVVTTCDVRITIKLHIREQRELCVDK